MKTASAAPTNGRSYISPLRERQSEQTREAILEAIAAELAENGLQELHIPAVARRAGVSIRTVYRYFPTRDALLDAAEEWIDRSIGSADFSRSIDEFPSMTENVFRQFDANETMMLAHWATSLGRDVRERGRKRRQQAYKDALRDITGNLSRTDARAAHAVISYLMSSRTWKTLREEFGMSGAESGKAAAWALRVLIADIKRRNEISKESPGTTLTPSTNT
jgi:AcrR family transcriptional regulator